MSTYRVNVILRNGEEVVVYVKSAKSRDELATYIAGGLREFNVATIKHNAGVLIVVKPLSVEVS